MFRRKDMRRKERLWVVLAVLSLLVGTVPQWVSAAPPAQEGGENLLVNPGFEGINCPSGGWCDGNWTRDTYNSSVYGEIFTPQGWTTFWNAGTNPADGRQYGRPECKVIPNAPPFVGPPARVRSGNYAIMQFGFFRSIDSGVYQVVSGLTPGATVKLSAYAHSWSCDKDEPIAYSCGDDYNMLFRVGIDPNGGANPWSPSIVWASGYSYDEFRKIGPVETQVGEGGRVTVFLRATSKWAYKHSDVYWDDAKLVYTEPPAPPTNTPPPPPPTATYGPPPTPMPPPTPRPDGASVHIVQSGDTLLGVALRYGVPLAQIEQLNAGSIGPNNIIRVGQELVISIPAASPTPSVPAPDLTTPEAPEPASPSSEIGSVCVLAYHDRNGDTFRQADTEELLPNAVFSLGDATGLLGQYTTDGLSEPYCFTGLGSGTYRVLMQPPQGYAVSGPSEMYLGMGAAARLDAVFGAQRSDELAPGEETAEGTESGGSEESDSALSQVLRWGARISGILMLVLAVGVAVVFVLSRRQ
jgi:LysM repeat protein